jgi:hypothetical protein
MLATKLANVLSDHYVSLSFSSQNSGNEKFLLQIYIWANVIMVYNNYDQRCCYVSVINKLSFLCFKPTVIHIRTQINLFFIFIISSFIHVWYFITVLIRCHFLAMEKCFMRTVKALEDIFLLHMKNLFFLLK